MAANSIDFLGPSYVIVEDIEKKRIVIGVILFVKKYR